LDKQSNRRGYVVENTDAMLPSDDNDIHRYFASVHFNLWDFHNYAMMLAGIYYAGRFDGYAEVQHQDFNLCSRLFNIENGWIGNLAQRVKEKADNKWHIYNLFFNDHTPKRCYLRHLLVLAGPLHSFCGLPCFHFKKLATELAIQSRK
jgi:hypothetical protein